MPPNAAVQRPRAALSSATHVHNEMAHVRRARADLSRSAATACYAARAADLRSCAFTLRGQTYFAATQVAEITRRLELPTVDKESDALHVKEVGNLRDAR
jgi:hypothetical protein